MLVGDGVAVPVAVTDVEGAEVDEDVSDDVPDGEEVLDGVLVGAGDASMQASPNSVAPPLSRGFGMNPCLQLKQNV